MLLVYPCVIPDGIEPSGMTRGLAPSDAYPCFACQRLTLLIYLRKYVDIYVKI